MRSAHHDTRQDTQADRAKHSGCLSLILAARRQCHPAFVRSPSSRLGATGSEPDAPWTSIRRSGIAHQRSLDERPSLLLERQSTIIPTRLAAIDIFQYLEGK